MEHESIGSIIRTTIEEFEGEFQAEDIAAKVVASISPDLHTVYLHELVSSRVSAEASSLRSRNTPARKNLSTKQKLIRDEYWPRFLMQKIALPGGYKSLGDASADELLFIAQMRRSQANDLVGKAKQFEALAKLMRETGAPTLGRLDPGVGERLLAA